LRTVTIEALQLWKEAALSVQKPLRALPAPLPVLLEEATEIVGFLQEYWSAKPADTGHFGRPGLALAAKTGFLSEGLASEILELQHALLQAQHASSLCDLPTVSGLMERGTKVLSELRAGLHYMRSGSEELSAQLKVVARANRRPRSQDALAMALDDYAALARHHAALLDGLGAFDPAMVEEAPQLAEQLRQHSANKLSGNEVQRRRAAFDLRNRIASLLYERMNRVRAAARFVFREHPEIVRKATSAFQRKRRAELRRARRVPTP
jgi:hypothetical protein